MAVPSTVTAALADRPVEGRRCLEAGAGVGNTTAGLLDAGAERVYAVTNDREHARTTRERVADDTRSDRLAVLDADLRTLALSDDSIDLITAHGLCNVLDPAALSAVAATFRRVAAPGCHLVIDDYAPLPETAAVRELFAVENAASELATGGPALTFYPPDALRRCFVGGGWSFDRERTLLDPVPWTGAHLSAHADVARDHAAACPGDLGDRLAARADRLATEIGSESVGRMYSLAFRLPA
ncbi:class I SAM-dependent methyltransferase [Halomicrobium sp. IBSBa]|uniref:class I SAM-dependent methyltransferase n=1 Tax=Halomicrobium sp. IBSBa TaxID=2778916 RepID=UPI001ABF877A|nr:class I SAM-dependent methyltransferase [Halomicrobium sp. IBSBa]MBO4247122.1 class I SAM-dependent methyltransferase [Halomicrobium sp. IBSBa]